MASPVRSNSHQLQVLQTLANFDVVGQQADARVQLAAEQTIATLRAGLAASQESNRVLNERLVALTNENAETKKVNAALAKSLDQQKKASADKERALIDSKQSMQAKCSDEFKRLIQENEAEVSRLRSRRLSNLSPTPESHIRARVNADIDTANQKIDRARRIMNDIAKEKP